MEQPRSDPVGSLRSTPLVRALLILNVLRTVPKQWTHEEGNDGTKAL